MRQPHEIIRAKRRRAAQQSGFAILIRDLAVITVIGVPPHERASSQPIVMDLDIEVATSRAGETDDLGDTIDYGEVVEDLRKCLAGKRYFLLERLAEYVADRILSRYGAQRVRVKVAKIGILKDVGSVGVTLERSRVREAETRT
jgi:dihydroneopterin aldolase